MTEPRCTHRAEFTCYRCAPTPSESPEISPPYSTPIEESVGLFPNEVIGIGEFGAPQELLDRIDERRHFEKRERRYRDVWVSAQDHDRARALHDAREPVNRLRRVVRPNAIYGHVDLERTLLWFVVRSHHGIAELSRAAKERARQIRRRASAETWCLVLSFLIESHSNERAVAVLTSGALGDKISESTVAKLCDRAATFLTKPTRYAPTKGELADMLWLAQNRFLKLADTAAYVEEGRISDESPIDREGCE